MAIRAGQGHWGDAGRENTEQGDTAVLQPSQWPGQTAEGGRKCSEWAIFCFSLPLRGSRCLLVLWVPAALRQGGCSQNAHF